MTTTAHLGANGSGPAASDPDEAGEPGGRGPLRGLAWLVWRQHRLFFGLLLAVVVGGAVWCAVLRSRAGGFIASHHIEGCSMISSSRAATVPRRWSPNSAAPTASPCNSPRWG